MFTQPDSYKIVFISSICTYLCVDLADALGPDLVEHALRLEVLHDGVDQTGVLYVELRLGRVLRPLSGVRHGASRMIRRSSRKFQVLGLMSLGLRLACVLRCKCSKNFGRVANRRKVKYLILIKTRSNETFFKNYASKNIES